MSKFGGSVSYKNKNLNHIKINKNIIARIESLDQNITKIYFVNEDDVSIQVPMGMELRDDNSEIPYGVYNGTESYMITWFSNYVMSWNGKEVFGLINQKQQAIKIPKDSSMNSDKQRTLYDCWNINPSDTNEYNEIKSEDDIEDEDEITLTPANTTK